MYFNILFCNSYSFIHLYCYDYRNGTNFRSLTTRVGTLTLRIPRLRNGKFTTDLFNWYPRSEQALVLALMEFKVAQTSAHLAVFY